MRRGDKRSAYPGIAGTSKLGDENAKNIQEKEPVYNRIPVAVLKSPLNCGESPLLVATRRL